MDQAAQDAPHANQFRHLVGGPAARAFAGVVAVIGATILSGGFLVLGLVSTLSTPAASLTWTWYLAAVVSAAAAVGASAWLSRLHRE